MSLRYSFRQKDRFFNTVEKYKSKANQFWGQGLPLDLHKLKDKKKEQKLKDSNYKLLFKCIYNHVIILFEKEKKNIKFLQTHNHELSR